MARPITLDGGGVAPGTLLFRRMKGKEELGKPFEYELEVESIDDALSFSSVVGQHLAVHLELPGGSLRHFHGLVTRFAQADWSQRRAVYKATLHPSLWLLKRRAGCRIFQNQAVPQIVRTVLSEYGFPFQESFSGSYPPREYVVQYRETDFDFVSRLLEQEGIYYFFRHEAAKHTLVLADSVGAHQKLPGYEEIPFYPPQEGERRERDHIDRWQVSHRIESIAFSLRDHDFTKPRDTLEVKRAGGKEGSRSPELEIYDYPGGYVQPGEGERYARTRLEESLARQERADGAGNARGMCAGMLFTMREHPRRDQNREYLVVSATCELAETAQESGSPSEGPVFRCSFTALDRRTPFRPECSTPRPLVQGPQTARVVGKAGEEIWTDSYGRVKVEFHWDRASPGDEQSSCWVRVAQAWSGAGWGAMHIPRIGQEVVVHFLEGDPDRPLVAGHLYEAAHMPPYPLPANQTRSGFRSRSTKGGGADNANEIRLEDEKGEEQLYLQAEKNYDLLVKNDASSTVGHDEKREVKNDETHSVGHDRRLSVGNDDTVDVKANRTETVGGNEAVSVAGNATHSVTGDESVSVGGARTKSVTRMETVTLSAGRQATVTGDDQLSVSQARRVVADVRHLITQGNTTFLFEGGHVELRAGGYVSIVHGASEIRIQEGGGAISVHAPTMIELTCGGSGIRVTPSKVEVFGESELSLTGGAGTVKLDPAGVAVSGPKLTSAAASLHEISGSIVKVN